MITRNSYVLVAKVKKGEMDALNTVPLAFRGTNLIPLLEFIQQMDPLEQENRINQIQLAWGPRNPCFFDPLIAPGQLRQLGERFFARDIPAVPVLRLGASSEQCSHVQALNVINPVGVCIRISGNEQPGPVLAARLNAVLNGSGCVPASTDIVVDLGELPNLSQAVVLRIMVLMNGLPLRDEWRSVIIAAGSFPKTVSEALGTSTERTITRYEWELYGALRALNLQRIPTYGDYGVNHPSVGLAMNRRPAPAIRYTLQNSFLITKGSIRQGPAFRRNLSQDLVARPEFAGASFSPGDERLMRCAQGQTGPGNATTWRTIDTSHHAFRVMTDLPALP